MSIAKLLKNPHFWLFTILILGAGFLINSVDVDSLSAQTQVVGEGTPHFLAKWVGEAVIPTYVIAPASASRQVGETQQFIGWYDPDGPSGSQAQQNKTTSASWISSDTSVATISSGLAACVSSGSITITSVYSGITVTASLTCTALPKVPQCTFTANPASILLPQSSTLSWSCQYADSCSIDQGIGSVSSVSGAKNVTPTQTTTYTLTCQGLGSSSKSYQTTVNVGFIPRIREIIPR